MTFSKVLKHDIKQGIIRLLPTYLYVFVFTFVNSTIFFNTIYPGLETIEYKATFGDLFFNIFAGMLPAEFYANDKPIPIALLALILPFFFIILYYPLKDLYGFGSQLLCRCKTRALWVSSKILHILLSCAIYFLILFASLLIFALSKNISFSMVVNEETLNYFNLYGVSLTINIKYIFAIFLAFFTTALLQLFISFFIGTLFGYCVTAIMTTASIFVYNKFFIGNYIMLLRYGSVFGDELKQTLSTTLNIDTGIIIMLSYCLIILICLYYMFCKKFDILNGVK